MFKNPVDFRSALQWMVKENARDLALVFVNNSSMTIKGGEFEEFEDLSDDTATGSSNHDDD